MENGAAEGPGAGDTATGTPDPPAGDGQARRRRAALILGAVGGAVALDQVTKAWAVWALADAPIHVIGHTVELRLTRNPGSAFSTFGTVRGATPLLAGIAAVVAWFLARTLRRATDGWVTAGLALLLGGALGNLVDRVGRAPGFLSGHVIDFVSIGWWPVFNVADSAITVGAVLLVLRSWRAHE